MTVEITRANWEVVRAHARATYPEECCGIIVERDDGEEVIRVTNVQNAIHARDPEQFPRLATTAYTMGPEAVPILLAADRGQVVLRAFYHSHPDHDAYFSAEDRTQALGGWSEPSYPQARQVVLSVRAGEVVAAKAFGWDEALQDFTEIAIVVR